MTPRGLVVLGSTGSIGRQTLDVVRSLPGRFRVLGLSAGSNADLLAAQVKEFDVPFCASNGTRLTMEELVCLDGVDLVVVATSSTAALGATLRALECGKAVATANKEVLVAAGEFVVETARRHGATLLPIDSEHSAVWQCLRGEDQSSIARIVLTASGGAFRDFPISELASVSPAQALKHPVWRMGAKVTVDTATLVNKAFEVIEAHWLFGVPYDRIEVAMHRESIVHAVVDFVDGSSKALLGEPDMRIPIQHALTHPDRVLAPFAPLDLARLGRLTFSTVDPERYPAFEIVLEAARRGATYPAALSAANDVAVEAFLAGRVGFGEIATTLRQCLEDHTAAPARALGAILDAERWGRRHAEMLLAEGAVASLR